MVDDYTYSIRIAFSMRHLRKNLVLELINLPSVAFATSSDGKSFGCEYFTQTQNNIKKQMALCAISVFVLFSIHFSGSNYRNILKYGSNCLAFYTRKKGNRAALLPIPNSIWCRKIRDKKFIVACSTILLLLRKGPHLKSCFCSIITTAVAVLEFAVLH